MKSDGYSRSIELRCSTCAGTQFEHEENVESDELVHIRCIGCNRMFSKQELIRENAENIDAHVSEVGEEILQDFAKDMKKSLQNAFRGNKYIKFK